MPCPPSWLASPGRIFQGRCRLVKPSSIWSLVCPSNGPLQDSDPSSPLHLCNSQVNRYSIHSHGGASAQTIYSASPDLYPSYRPCCRRNISRPPQLRGNNKSLKIV
ncbi:Vacuolar membrane amino acid uptake transporter fnx2 [Fusarium oxysporum f. sp. albedinis]|nr:Vacuolar membrane amino acid uptake transporter fnx2 [Fusarium oxysporum f. sp. albedinis]